ncbi:MAG: type IV pilus assembly protein PilM [Candidatus Kerfeldbacteria bacterium]
MLNLNPFTNQIGLDISDFKMRFIQIDTKKKSKMSISSFGEIDVPKDHIINGEIKNKESVISLLKTLIEKPEYGKVEKKYVNASLSEKMTYIKVIEIPDVPENELKGAVGWGIEQNIPIALDQTFFDWQVINKNEKNNKLRVLASVAPKNIVNTYTEVIKKAGLIPISLENESVAVTRSLIDQQKNINNSLLVIDIGRSRTSLIIFSHNTVQYTSTINVSGHEMTEAISNNLQLSYKDAEKAKIIYGLHQSKGRGAVRKSISPILDRLLVKINENVNYFNEYMATKSKINTALLTGSVSQTSGLTEYLQAKLKQTTILADPWTNLTILKGQEELKERNFYPFATCIGLAIKKFD